MAKYSKNGVYLGSALNNNIFSDNSYTSSSTTSSMSSFYKSKAQECFDFANKFESMANDALSRGDTHQYQFYKNMANSEKRRANEWLEMAN